MITLGRVLGAADRYVDSIGLSIQVQPVKEPETGGIQAMGLHPSLIAAVAADFQVVDLAAAAAGRFRFVLRFCAKVHSHYSPQLGI